jgi:hydrogenase nickel incorporation protein HypB
MHEMSIAFEVARIVEDRIGPERLPRVATVHLEVGDEAGVEFGSLQSSLDVVLTSPDQLAADVRQRLANHAVTALNLVSSPGSGKTTLLERTLAKLGGEIQIATVTGDVQTQNDADRLAKYTDKLVQAVVTGGACHLDARQILSALDRIDLENTDLIFIENVGNLVCPASWDLGEQAKIVLFSVTEGEDKPLKYPKMFRESRYAVLNKIDLLPHLQFDVGLALANAREVNPDLQVMQVSATTGEGMDQWYELLRRSLRD